MQSIRLVQTMSAALDFVPGSTHLARDSRLDWGLVLAGVAPLCRSGRPERPGRPGRVTRVTRPAQQRICCRLGAWIDSSFARLTVSLEKPRGLQPRRVGSVRLMVSDS